MKLPQFFLSKGNCKMFHVVFYYDVIYGRLIGSIEVTEKCLEEITASAKKVWDE